MSRRSRGTTVLEPGGRQLLGLRLLRLSFEERPDNVRATALPGDSWQSLAARAYSVLASGASPAESAGRYWPVFIDYDPTLDPLTPPEGGRTYVGPPVAVVADTFR